MVHEQGTMVGYCSEVILPLLKRLFIRLFFDEQEASDTIFVFV